LGLSSKSHHLGEHQFKWHLFILFDDHGEIKITDLLRVFEAGQIAISLNIFLI